MIAKRVGKVCLVVIIIVAAICVCLIGLVMLARLQNQRNLESLTDAFEDEISGFENVRIVEIRSVYGKLNGNGNGINYFGAALIEKESVPDIEEIVAELGKHFEAVEYCDQKACEISSRYLEHITLKYETEISGGTEYISIFFFESQHPDSNYMDIAGH